MFAHWHAVSLQILESLGGRDAARREDTTCFDGVSRLFRLYRFCGVIRTQCQCFLVFRVLIVVTHQRVRVYVLFRCLRLIEDRDDEPIMELDCNAYLQSEHVVPFNAATCTCMHLTRFWRQQCLCDVVELVQGQFRD